MDKLWGIVLAEIAGTHRSPPSPGRLRKMLLDATRAQRNQLRWGILPYKTDSHSNRFATLTGNLHGLPWIILDLRGRMQPFLLRVGVGIGTLNGPVQEPVTALEGESVRLAQQALAELQILNSKNFSRTTHRRTGPSSRCHTRARVLTLKLVFLCQALPATVSPFP